MALRRGAAILVAMVVATLALAPAAQAGGQRFVTTLTGAVEVPGPGDSDGSGTAVITINRGARRPSRPRIGGGVGGPFRAADPAPRG